ncbi:MAG: hypothetical protein A2826_02585 [Candidatus Doudnabacteria bacterium RIFCSPHIGHO2_01_FULL_43_23]|uniref:Uncharacterized protein n=1 Tax=Candidatus Doudnabacteria bacterium RIFCSPHIGHO2_01_FULL_43_23 TaxID=1817822 RepID=A0A1F5NW84_9BACT|nr:MAG: hypothetical protein A2826_02585 [Candidatus Doudnabacteria bacterium RIFCSPHIGHO2_01_FULL_43_23]
MSTQKTQLSPNIITAFWTWYFLVAPKNILEIWSNYLSASLQYFSVFLLLRTLISPWHRDTTSYGRGFDFKRYLEVWSLNMVARVIGLIIRLATIAIAIVSGMLILAVGFLFLIFWLMAPVALTAAFFWGFILLF